MTDAQDPSRLHRIPPAAWFFTFLLAGWGLDFAYPLPIPFSSFAWQLTPALFLFAASTLFAAWAIRLFASQRTSLLPFGKASSLLTSGPFRLSRNPLYVALVATLAAFALLLASFWLLLCAALLFLALNRFIIPAEETILLSVFGTQYSTYAGQVRRWL